MCVCVCLVFLLWLTDCCWVLLLLSFPLSSTITHPTPALSLILPHRPLLTVILTIVVAFCFTQISIPRARAEGSFFAVAAVVVIVVVVVVVNFAETNFKGAPAKLAATIFSSFRYYSVQRAAVERLPPPNNHDYGRQ